MTLICVEGLSGDGYREVAKADEGVNKLSRVDVDKNKAVGIANVTPRWN